MTLKPPNLIDPIDAWNNLVEWADDAEYAALEAMTPGEIEAELVSIGDYDGVARPPSAPTAPVSGTQLTPLESRSSDAESQDPARPESGTPAPDDGGKPEGGGR